jgi:hypothetical protein
MTLPVVLFFARGYQADFFPTLLSPRYDPVFVTLRREERRAIEARGCRVAACFEEDFDAIQPAEVPTGYLLTSYTADRFLGRFSMARRLEILGKEIAFWRGLLAKYKPVATVNEVVALEISEVLLLECRRKGVRYLAGMNCVVDDLFYWLADPISLSGSHLRLPEPDDRARQQAVAYVEEVLAKDYKPFYVKNLAGRRDVKPLLVGLAKWVLWIARRASSRFQGRFRYELYDGEYGKRIEVYVKSLLLKYDALEAIPPSTEVVFFPLHQEPEATLNYMSEFYANQVATIENILRCMTPNQILVVKEHPLDKGSLLRSKFQHMRREHSCLYFLPAEIHGRQILNLASRVVTLTSTVGWEAAILGKPTHVLGQIFYDDLPGLKRLKDFEELRRYLREPPSGPTITREQVLDFVARMAAGCYPGNPFPHDALYTELNRERVIHAICDAAGI